MDLMILDVMMPGLDGFTVCKTAREMGGMPIILLTARAREDDKLRGYDFGGTTRTVDTHVKTLRQKLGDEGRHIVTLIRSGYKFEEEI